MRPALELQVICLSAWCGRYRRLLIPAGPLHLFVVVVATVARLLPAQGVVLLTLSGFPLHFGGLWLTTVVSSRIGLVPTLLGVAVFGALEWSPAY